MLYTYRVPFSHDKHDSVEAFADFASLVREQLGDGPVPLRVVSSPIFSYGQRTEKLREDLSSLFAKGDNSIVYLSDIEYYATVLVSAPSGLTVPRCNPFATYQSFDELLNSPRMVGYGLPKDFSSQFVVPQSHVVIGQLMYSAYDESTDEPNAEWYDIVRKARPKHVTGPVHAYRVRDSSKCLEHIVCSDEPTYILPESDGLDIDEFLARYNHFEDDLTEHLIASSIPFATINDGHWDDCFAVSYRSDVWRLGDSFRYFIA